MIFITIIDGWLRDWKGQNSLSYTNVRAPRVRRPTVPLLVGGVGWGGVESGYGHPMVEQQPGHVSARESRV